MKSSVIVAFVIVLGFGFVGGAEELALTYQPTAGYESFDTGGVSGVNFQFGTIEDLRTETEIGVRDGSTPLTTSTDLLALAQTAWTQELQGLGFSMGSGGATIDISLDRFWIEVNGNDVRAWIDFEADVSSTSGGQAWRGRTGGSVEVTGSGMENEALSNSLREAVLNVLSDPGLWQNVNN